MEMIIDFSKKRLLVRNGQLIDSSLFKQLVKRNPNNCTRKQNVGKLSTLNYFY